MMNIGGQPIFSDLGVVTSLAWKTRGQVQYVLEGNINYTGAVISWLKNDIGLLQSAGESEALAKAANPQDKTYLVPAFSGLGAPYWRSDVSAAFVGMKRTTGRAELVKAGLESIAYQITDVVKLMQQEAAIDRVVYLVGHHHTYTDVDSADYRILLEADYLVNAEESGYAPEAIRRVRETLFKTAAGTALLDSLYFPA